MRGIAAIAVMISHYTLGQPNAWFTSADLAVDFFFCLSGFVLGFSYQNAIAERGIIWFIKRRVFRLYPVYMIGMLIVAIALIFQGGISAFADSSVPFFLNLLYIPYFPEWSVWLGERAPLFSIFPLNVPAWSLFFEFFVNVLFGIFVLGFRKHWLKPVCMVSALSLIYYVVTFKASDPGWGTSNFFGGIPRVCYSFFVGVFLVKLVQLRALQESNALSSSIVVLLVVVLLLPHMNPYFWVATVLLLIPAFVFWGALYNSQSKLMLRMFNYLGLISYPVYCFHWPVRALCSEALQGMSEQFIVTASLFLTLGAAHVVAKYVEQWSIPAVKASA